jgi:hypothetical protein
MGKTGKGAVTGSVVQGSTAPVREVIVNGAVELGPAAVGGVSLGLAGAVGGAGLGAGIGMVVAGPPGAAVGYLAGLGVGTIGGAGVGAVGARRLQKSIKEG